jgi:TPR repeat protein
VKTKAECSFLGLSVLAMAGALAFGCGPRVGPLPTPETRKFVDDTDPQRVRVDIVKNRSMPFIVDWEPEHRGDLEIAAKRGPAVVHFDERALELLQDCRAPGAYVYAGFTPKGEVKTMHSAAELHANLPVNAASLEARLKSAGSLSIAIRMVGKHELDRPALTRAQLQGQCERATHYVRRLTVGAFRFSAGESRSGGAQARVLGAQAGGSADASNQLLQYDGDFTACDRADVDAENAPPNCRALLRIELVPLDQGGVAESESSAPECGAGMRWDGEACVSTRRLEAEPQTTGADGEAAPGGFECDPKNGRECLAQCKLGNLPSCASLGWHLLSGSPEVPKDEARALELWKRTCQKGELAKACLALNVYYSERQQYREALIYGSKACLGGEPGACTNVAVNAFYGQGTARNRASAFKLWTRACRMRDFQGCNNAGVMILWGMEGVPRNQEAARVLFERACESPGREGCGNLAAAYELGLGGPKDLAKALALATADCDRSANSCVTAGLLLTEHATTPNAPQQARELFERGCAMPPVGGCLTEQEMRGYMPNAYSAEGFDRRACDDAPQSALACYNAAITYERGDGGPVDLARAKEFLDKACKTGLKKACRTPARR